MQQISQSSYNQVKSILRNNYVNDGIYSHVSLVSPKGKYGLMSRPLLEKFWEHYSNAIQEGCDKFGLAEVPQMYIPVLVDVDMKFKGDEIKYENGHFYSEDFVKKVICVYQNILREMVILQDDETFENILKCIWLEKAPYKVISGADEVWKNGFHLHFPNLFLSKIEQETRIIPAVKKHLDEHYEEYGIEGKIIDSKAIGNAWLLYGSVKDEGMLPYDVGAIYDEKCARMDVEKALLSCKIYDSNEQQIALNCANYISYLPRILSILPYGRRYLKVKKDNLCARDYLTNLPSFRAQADRRGATDLVKVKKLMNLLGANRSEGHDDWMTVGWAIYNITSGAEEGLDMWVKFSLQTDEHDEDRCIYEWSRMSNRGTYTVGTLIHFARMDDPIGYRKFVSLNNKTRENYSELGLAEIFYEYCQEEFVYCDKTWFRFSTHYWVEDREALNVKSRMIEVLKMVLDVIWKEKVNAVPEGAEQPDPKKEASIQARAGLGTIRLVNNILEFAKQKFVKPAFTSQLNREKYLIGFANGVYDLKNFLFRKGQPSDMITNHMTISYDETYSMSHPKVIETLNFFEKVITNPNVRRYFMDIMSEVFIGYNQRKNVYFWTGEGDNAKSVTQMFFSKLLGTLCVKAPTTLITSKRGATGSANAEMSRLGNGVRLVFLEEPDPSEEIHTGIFKHLSGNDDFYTRDLYQAGKDVREIQAMFKISVICNSLPRIRGGGDRATWNRVRVIPFTSVFTKNAPFTIEEQFKTSTFPVDTTLDRKIPGLLEALAWILLKHLKEPRGDEPIEVTQATLEYRTSNDMIAGFMNIHMIEDEKSFASKFDLYEMYKEFCRDSCSGKRPLTFMEFTKAMIKKLGTPCPVKDGWAGYKAVSISAMSTKPQSTVDLLS